ITQLEMHPCRVEDVTWDGVGDRGYWKSYKPRGGDVRYNLVYRHDDHLHVFYGVTDEGIDEEWRNALPAHLAERQLSNGLPEHVDDMTVDAVDASDAVIDEQPQAPVFGALNDPAAATSEVVVSESIELPVSVDAPGEAQPAAEEPPGQAKPRRTRARKPKATEPDATTAETSAPEPPEVAPSVEAVAATEPVVTEQPVDEPPPKPKRTRRPATPRKKKMDAAEQPAEAMSEQAASTMPESIVEAAPEAPSPEEPPKPKRTRRPATPRKKKTDSADAGETPDAPAQSQEREGA
ncbi:MAG: hypothetical protein M3439_04245, partial [Chloroflexota bacterium]|nr:hypothetical protein [Chloroflexota bacterium]